MSDKPKVLIFISSLGVGGAEHLVANLLKGIDKQKFELHFLTYYPARGSLPAYNIPSGVVPHFIPKHRAFDLAFLRELRDIFRREKFHLVHSVLDGPNFFSRLLARQNGVRHLITELLSCRTDLWKLPLEIMLRGRADIALANSEAGRSFLIRKVGYPASRTHVIITGINLDEFRLCPYEERATLQKKLGWEEGKTHFLLLGRISPEKNQRLIVRATARIPSEFRSRMRIHIVGPVRKKSYRDLLRKELVLRRVDNFVRLEEPAQSARDAISASDALLVTSVREGLPNVILEAWAVGRPVIATAVSDIPKLLEESQAGLSFPSGDSASLAEWLMHFCSLGESERAEMGLRGRRYVENNFSLEEMIKRYQELYESVLSGETGAREMAEVA